MGDEVALHTGPRARQHDADAALRGASDQAVDGVGSGGVDKRYSREINDQMAILITNPFEYLAD